jgi:hypothetical protein
VRESSTDDGGIVSKQYRNNRVMGKNCLLPLPIEYKTYCTIAQELPALLAQASID